MLITSFLHLNKGKSYSPSCRANKTTVHSAEVITTLHVQYVEWYHTTSSTSHFVYSHFVYSLFVYSHFVYCPISSSPILSTVPFCLLPFCLLPFNLLNLSRLKLILWKSLVDSDESTYTEKWKYLLDYKVYFINLVQNLCQTFIHDLYIIS